MKSKFIMTAMATLLAFQVAVADEVKSSKNESSNGHYKDAKKVKSGYKGPKVSINALVDFQFAIPSNEKIYKHSVGEKFLNRAYDKDSNVAKEVAAISSVKQDHDGGVIGDYAKDKYYNTSALLSMKLEQVSPSISVGSVLEILTPFNSYRNRHFSGSVKNKGAYVFLNSPYFVLQAGYAPGAEQMFKTDVGSFSAAGGGIAGDWIEYANLEGSYAGADSTSSPKKLQRDVSRPFHATPALYSQYYGMIASKIANNNGSMMSSNDISISPKVVIYSHDVNGFKMGMSYSPGYVNYSNNSDLYKKAGLRQYENILGFGASYEKEMSNYLVKLALAGEMGKAAKEGDKDPDYNDLLSMSAGGTLKFNDMITVGAEYGYLGKSGLGKKIVKDPTASSTVMIDATPDNSYYMAVASSYDMGPAKVSTGYYRSYQNPYSTDADKDGSIMSDINVGVSYNVTHACMKTKFTPYFSYHQFSTKENHFVTKDSDNNSGYVMMLGVKAQF